MAFKAVRTLQKTDTSTSHPGKLIPPWDLFANPMDEIEAICRQRVAPVYMGDGQVLSRVLARFKFLTSTHDTGFAPHIIMDGYWEMWLTA
ncbi:MAG: hypothetical protein AB7U34_01845 [Novosphingobium sp.]